MSKQFNAIVDADRILRFVEQQQKLVDEAVIQFGEDGLTTMAVDPANVCGFKIHLDAPAFESYEASGFGLGVNLSRLGDYLDAGSSGDLAHLSFDGETNRIDIEVGDASFSMAGIDPDSVRNPQDIDDMDAWDPDSLVCDVGIDPDAFEHAIGVAGMVSDHIRFVSDPDADDQLTIRGEGDTDDAEVSPSNSVTFDPGVTADGESLFSEDYWDSVVKSFPKTSHIKGDARLRHGNEWPCRVDYEWAEGHGSTSYFLAPRIQSK
jgi:proliferating cell nuclear antigen